VVVGCVKRRNGSLFRLIVSESPLVACLLHEGLFAGDPDSTGTDRYSSLSRCEVEYSILVYAFARPSLKRNGIIEEENPRIDDRAEISSTSR
jgi:hypothetical protein